MRTLCVTAVVAAFLLVSQGAAHAGEGVPQRPGAPLVPVLTSQNGGDNGWGNCGHNSSGGLAHSDPDGAGQGNGGYTKDECLAGTDPILIN